jgi:hypothetical protein
MRNGNMRIFLPVTGRSEGEELHCFWNQHWGKHRQEAAGVTHLCLMEFVHISMPTLPHLAGSPLGSSLYFGHQSSFWESICRSNIFWTALHVRQWLFLNSTLIFHGMLVVLDLNCCSSGYLIIA